MRRAALTLAVLAAADLTLAGMAATLAPAPWAGGAAQAQPIPGGDLARDPLADGPALAPTEEDVTDAQLADGTAAASLPTIDTTPAVTIGPGAAAGPGDPGDDGAATLLAGDMGCLLNMAGRLQREGAPVQVRHVAEVLAGMTVDAPAIGEGKA